jgi:hypothetical protein
MRLFDLDNADLLAQTMELDPPKWFDQDVRQLIVSVNVLDGNLTVFDFVPYEVVGLFNVLAPAMKDQIFVELDDRLIFDTYSWGSGKDRCGATGSATRWQAAVVAAMYSA